MFPYFELFGQTLYTYPLMLGIIWSLSYNFILHYFSSKKIPYLKSFLVFVFVISWIFAKIFYLISVDIETYDSILYNSNFWLGGGFVFFGGFLGGLFCFLIFLKISKTNIEEFKIFVPVLTFSHALGRLGCLMAGCCFGKVCDLPWSIHLHGASRHPVQLYEASVLFIFSLIFYKRVKNGKSVFLEYILLYSTARFSLEIFRGDKIRGIYMLGLSSSQIISILLCIGVFGIIFYRRKAAN